MPVEFVQEACLGRVRMRTGKHQFCYLMKWLGWDKLKDITCEPSDNVHVLRVEEPTLDQRSSEFDSELAALLHKYLDSRPHKKGLKRKVVADDEAAVSSCAAKKTPVTSVPRDAGLCEVVQDNNLFTVVNNRQYVPVPGTQQPQAGWLCVFAVVRVALLNPGLAFAHRAHLVAPDTPAGPDARLYGSVDSASKGGGVGWFHHPLSGISIDGIRCSSSSDVPRFNEGDTIGLVIHQETSTAYLVKNYSTVAKVVFNNGPSSRGLGFYLHLCPGDRLEVLPEIDAVQRFEKNEGVLVLETQEIEE